MATSVRLAPERLTGDQQAFFAGIRAKGDVRVAAEKRQASRLILFFSVVVVLTLAAVILSFVYTR
jgi:hypothetical protein